MSNKIYPCLWFNDQAKAAALFYCTVFGHGKIVEETPLVVTFELDGQKFMGLNGGPMFTPNPSISFYTVFEEEDTLDAAWQQLSAEGAVLMPLNRYEWSTKYGWLQDRFGVSWQLTLGNIAEVGQKYTPLLMFANAQQGKAEAAIQFYTGLFEQSAVMGIARFTEAEPTPGHIKHAQFKLQGQTFMAMDSPLSHAFDFGEGISLVVDCKDQTEVDYFWDNFTRQGQESRCAWLKDEFGVSWQIVPEALPRLMNDPDPVVAKYALNAMLQMKKIEIDKLRPSANGQKTVITIQTAINAPLQKVWQYWTQPEHIMQWNNASEDWHTPHASNDLRPGRRFVYHMAAKDGSFAFDFGGTYDEIIEQQLIRYTIDDDRKVSITFQASGESILVTEAFEAEGEHPLDMQRQGWSAILERFKFYVEG